MPFQKTVNKTCEPSIGPGLQNVCTYSGVCALPQKGQVLAQKLVCETESLRPESGTTHHQLLNGGLQFTIRDVGY